MQQESNLRNLIISMVLIGAVMLAAQIFVWEPDRKAREAELQAARDQQQTEQVLTEANQAGSASTTPAAPAAPRQPDVRIPFDGDSIDGSLLLRGSRIDHLKLKDYYETLEDKEEQNPEGEIQVFHPQQTVNGQPEGYYAIVGWRVPDANFLTDQNTMWQIAEGDTLTPDTPITLTYDADGVSISRKIEIDDRYMFTFTDTVTNTSGAERSVQPYGVLREIGLPEMDPVLSDRQKSSFILHQGFIAATGNNLVMQSYGKLAKNKDNVEATSTSGGWIGMTSKYWLGAIIPEQDQPFTVYSETRNTSAGQEYLGSMRGAISTLQPGQTITSVNRVFGGAKESEVLRAYEDNLNIPRFIDAIDWGSMFFWLTKPFFWLLTTINGYVGNFGVSILILTVLVKAVFFPIQNKAYQSMAKMRELAEPMKKIREETDDKQEQQRRMAELYREKKVNPVAGCLPILIQIPVFYGLYKTLFATIEMRHEPFMLWIKDLSAPDPTALGNLFGLLPVSNEFLANIPLLGTEPLFGLIPGIGILLIGVLPIVYGVTMWALQSLNPPPTDDTQKLIFGLMPIIFTFVFAGFMAGLVVYWCWSNILSIIQQYVIMRRNGVKTRLDTFLENRFGKTKGEA